MNLLAAIRRRKKAWICRLGAPIVAVWLAMAWHPCVMAMDAEMAHEHHCEHCPPPEIEHCGDAVRHECSDEDRLSADLRAAKAKSADDSKHVPVSLIASTQLHRLQVFKAQACLTDPATAPPGRPLPVLFCSYLN
jgi:hypothetical protein